MLTFILKGALSIFSYIQIYSAGGKNYIHPKNNTETWFGLIAMFIKYYVLWLFLDDLSTAGKFGLNKEPKSKNIISVCAKYHENYKYVWFFG